MWMLNKWFERESPTAIVLDGSQAIEGARFYSDEDVMDDRYLYICRMQDIYPSSTSSQVLLVFRNDTLSFTSDDANRIFNQVLGAFEFYNNWERRIIASATSEHPEQDIIGACEGLVGPAFIMDGSLAIIAHSTCYGTGEVNAFWDDVVLGGGFPGIPKTADSAFVRMHFTDHGCTAFEDESAAPYSYGISSSIHDSSGSVMGQMVIASREPMGPFEMQVASIVADALDSVRSRRIPLRATDYSESILADMLAGRIGSDDGGHKLMLLRGWKPGDLLRAARIEPGNSDASVLEALHRAFTLALPDAVFLIDGPAIVALMLADDAEGPGNPLSRASENGTVRVGLSNEFTGAENAAVHARQAEDALRLCDNNRRICRFGDVGLRVVMHAESRDYAAAAAHPAVARLLEWDATHGTALARTLRCFLENERSYARTAEALYVHRNTVLYRIAKAAEIAPFDLDDAYERQYLAVSFLLLDESEGESA